MSRRDFWQRVYLRNRSTKEADDALQFYDERFSVDESIYTEEWLQNHNYRVRDGKTDQWTYCDSIQAAWPIVQTLEQYLELEREKR